MDSPLVKELRTGKVKEMDQEDAKDPFDRKWKSAMFKEVQLGKIWLSTTGLESDEVADKKVHGGPEKALFAYPVTHYPFWQEELADDTIVAGAFGENLVLEGTDEFSTFIGDIYKFGEAIIQVSQPRRPCWKPARRFRVIDFSLRIQQSGKTGWYYRVLEEGYVEAGVKLELIDRPHPEWSIAAANEVMYHDTEDLSRTYDLVNVECLAENWKKTLKKRLRGQTSSDDARLYGPNKP